MGMLGGLVHAIATVIFGVDHIISGVAINIIALGAVQYLASLTFVGLPGWRSTQSPKIPDVETITIGPLSDGLRDIEENDTVLRLRGGGGAAAPWCTNLSSLVLLAMPAGRRQLVGAVAYRPSACGCGPAARAPAAAESLGVQGAAATSSWPCWSPAAWPAWPAASWPWSASSNYRDGQTGGRGYIGLAAMIFGNWRPGGLLAGSGLFGYTETLGLRQGGTSVHALLLALAVLALALGGASRCAAASRVSASVIVVVGVAARRAVLLDRRGARRLRPR